MKRFLFSLTSLLLGIGLFFWLFDQVGWQEVKKTILDFSSVEGIFLLVLAFGSTLLGALRWREILKSKGCFFSLKELYGYYLASFAITYLAPLIAFGGVFFRGYVLNLKEKNSAPLSKAMIASFIDGIFEHGSEVVAALLGLVSLFFLISFPFKAFRIAILILVIFLGTIFLYYLFFKKKSFIKIFLKIDEKSWGRKMEREIFSFFDFQNNVFQKAIFLSLAKTALTFFQYWVLVSFLGKSISFLGAVSVFGMSVIFMAPPISADIGTHDLGSVFLFRRLGLGQETGIVFASIVRGINLILAIGGIVFLIRTGFATLRRKIFKKIGKISQLYSKYEE